MVHALERARSHLRRDGVLILIQPRQWKRPSIAVIAGRKRESVAALINPAFQPLINAANAAIQDVVHDRQYAIIGQSDHRFRLRLANPAALGRYLQSGRRPPRFPRGGRRRLDDLWKSRMDAAQIEVTEFFSIIGLRAI